MESLYLLPILVAVSVTLLLIHLATPHIQKYIKSKFCSRKGYSPLFEDDEPQANPATQLPSQGLVKDLTAHIQAIGIWIFSFEVARALCLATLLGLSIYATIIAEGPGAHTNDLDVLKHGLGGKRRKKHKHRKHRNKDPLGVDEWSSMEWQEFAVSAFYVSSYARNRRKVRDIDDVSLPVLRSSTT
jgi:hypothetical protein